MKSYILLFTLFALLPLSVHADYIFEQAYEYDVHDEPWDAICLDGGDFNNDGLPDFVASYYDTSSEDTYLYTFLGNGDCSFDVLITNIFAYPLGSITVSDFNNDGYDDLLIGEGYGTYVGMTPVVRTYLQVFTQPD